MSDPQAKLFKLRLSYSAFVQMEKARDILINSINDQIDDLKDLIDEDDPIYEELEDMDHEINQ
jgi:hypothetical protein